MLGTSLYSSNQRATSPVYVSVKKTVAQILSVYNVYSYVKSKMSIIELNFCILYIQHKKGNQSFLDLAFPATRSVCRCCSRVEGGGGGGIASPQVHCHIVTVLYFSFKHLYLYKNLYLEMDFEGIRRLIQIRDLEIEK